jgi:hypothetical protein
MSDTKKEVSNFFLSVEPKKVEIPEPVATPVGVSKSVAPVPVAPANLEQAMAMLIQMQVENQKLTQMMFQREARKDAEEKAFAERIEQRDRQRRLNAREFGRQQMANQAGCKHQKGLGKGSIKGPVVDYAVYLHTFIDHSQTIKCRICKMSWRPGDTKEFLMVNGQKVKNHTNYGWAEAVEMTKQSTDKESSSEAPLNVTGDIADLLKGRDPSFIQELLNSPEGRSFLSRTSKEVA